MLALQQFGVQFQANWLSTIRNRTAVFFNLISPLLFFVLFGFIFGNQKGATPESVGLYLLPGVIVASQLSSGLFGGASVLVTWRERGIFRRIQATPMSVWQLILARVLAQVIISFAQALVTVIVGVLFFKVQLAAGGAFWDFLFILLGSLVFQVMGQLIAARIKRVETANILINVIFLPLLFFTDLYIPLSLMPDWLQNIGKLLPPYLVVDLLRSAMTQGTLPTNALADVIGLGIYFIVMLVISAAIFRFD